MRATEHKNKYVVIVIILLSIISSSCTSLFRNSDRPNLPVVIANTPPNYATSKLGNISATDGFGCGLIGLLGNRKDALYKLQQEAQKIGADYVHLYKTIEPRAVGKCGKNDYTVMGHAYFTGVSTYKTKSSAPNRKKIIAKPTTRRIVTDPYLRTLPADADLSLLERQLSLKDRNMYFTKSGEVKSLSSSKERSTDWRGDDIPEPNPGEFTGPGKDNPIMIDLTE